MRRENNVGCKKQIQVVGIGGRGIDVVDRMISAEIEDVQFLTIDIGGGNPVKCRVPLHFLMSNPIRKGLNCEELRKAGRSGIYEDRNEIKKALRRADILFLTAGLDEEIGSRAAPIIAGIAQELGILTIAVVTRPEGNELGQFAKETINKLENHVDSLIVTPSDQLLRSSGGQMRLDESLRIAARLISQYVETINEFVNLQGLINLDLANLKSILSKKGNTLVTVGRARGIDRARKAVEEALVCPTQGLSIDSARGMLVNITTNGNLDLREVQTITELIENKTHSATEFALGIVIDEVMGDEIRITTIATGLRDDSNVVAPNFGKSHRIQSSLNTIPVKASSPPSRLGAKKKRIFGFSSRSFPVPDFLQSIFIRIQKFVNGSVRRDGSHLIFFEDQS